MVKSNILPLKPQDTPDIKKPRKKAIPDIVNSNNATNDKIKIRAKKIKNGSYSLYLDLRQNGRKEYEFLSIYVKEYKKDKNLIDYAIELRNKKQKCRK